MDLRPVWRVPVDVQLESSSGDDLGDAFTLGLVSTELVESAPGRLLARLGRSAFETAAREVEALEGADPVSTVLETAARLLMPRLGPILDVADQGRRLPDEPVPDAVLDLAEWCGVPFRPTPLTRGDRTRWGLRFDTILQRAAAETIELYIARPRLRRCVFCNAVYVPLRNEANCRWNLWRWPARPGDPAIRQCVDDATINRFLSDQERHAADRDQDPARQHERNKKRLNIRYRRELARAGGDETNPLVTKYRREYEKYMGDPKRWRRPRGRPIVIAAGDLPHDA